jgi:hypothetical protein
MLSGIFNKGRQFFCCAAAETLLYYCGAVSPSAVPLPFLGVSSLNLAAPSGAAFFYSAA